MRKPWRHAEKFFEAIGAGWGATCTKPDHDQHGWDYFVEFPRRDDAQVPLDMVAPPPKCLVQIKSTKAKSATTSLKLSNALEFSKLDIPCFNVMLVYSAGEQAPSHAIVHHFWENEIRRTLRRARILDARGNRKAHKATIRLSKKTGTIVSPSKLLDHLLVTIKEVGPHYGDKKGLFAETVGFEETTATGNITYGEGVTIDDIVDLHIGLKNELPISQFKMTSLRFGIEASQPTADVKSGGSLQVTPSPTPCDLIVSSESTGARVKLPASMFSPGIPDLPKENMKVRAAAECAEATFMFGASTCNFRFDFQFEEQLGFAALLSRAELLAVCASPDINIRVVADGLELFNVNGSTTGFPKAGTSALPPVLDFLRHIGGNSIDIRASEGAAKATLRTLFENVDRINSYMVCVGDAKMIATANFDWAEPKYGEALCYYFVTVALGPTVACTLVRRPAQTRDAGNGRTEILFAPITYARPHVFDSDRNAFSLAMSKEIDRLSDLTKDIPVLSLGNLLENAA